MKRLSKMTSVIAAIGCAISMLLASTPLSASAVVYGDINNNGSVTMSDSVAMGKFLSGMGTLADYSSADLNLNCVIDAVDAKILTMYIMGSISTLPYTS